MENGFGIDYLTFTVKVLEHNQGLWARIKLEDYVKHLSKLSDGFLCMDKFELCDYGWNHYEAMLKYAGEKNFGICASEHGNNRDTVMISLSGQGIREIGNDLVFKMLSDAVNENGGNVTRLDICYDDYTHVIPLDKTVSAFKSFMNGKKVIESRFKRNNAQVINGIYDNIPYTNVTFGSRANGSQYMRLYDKRAEQGLKNVDVSNIPYWYRLELELRKECAMSAGIELLQSNFDFEMVFRLYLNRMFRILCRPAKETEEKHLDRINTAKWWSEFVGTNLKGKVTYKPATVEHDIDRMEKHIERSYAGYLYTYAQVRPQAFNSIINHYGDEVALKPKYQKILKGKYDLEF